MKNTFALVFQDSLCGTVPSVAFVTRHGPTGDTSVICGHTRRLPRTKFHEHTQRGRTAWATIRPEDHVVGRRVVSAFEEREEDVPRFKVNVSCVCTAFMGWSANAMQLRITSDVLDSLVTEFAFLYPNAVSWVIRMAKGRELVRRERRERLRWGKLLSFPAISISPI